MPGAGFVVWEVLHAILAYTWRCSMGPLLPIRRPQTAKKTCNSGRKQQPTACFQPATHITTHAAFGVDTETNLLRCHVRPAFGGWLVRVNATHRTTCGDVGHPLGFAWATHLPPVLRARLRSRGVVFDTLRDGVQLPFRLNLHTRGRKTPTFTGTLVSLSDEKAQGYGVAQESSVVLSDLCPYYIHSGKIQILRDRRPAISNNINTAVKHETNPPRYLSQSRKETLQNTNAPQEPGPAVRGEVGSTGVRRTTHSIQASCQYSNSGRSGIETTSPTL